MRRCGVGGAAPSRRCRVTTGADWSWSWSPAPLAEGPLADGVTGGAGGGVSRGAAAVARGRCAAHTTAPDQPRPRRRVLRLQVLGDVDRALDHLGVDQPAWPRRSPPSGCRRSAPGRRGRRGRAIVATAATLVFDVLHVVYLLAGVCDSQSWRRRCKRRPGAGKETAKHWFAAGQMARRSGVTVGPWRAQSAPGGRILVVEDEDSISEPFAEALRAGRVRAGRHPHRGRGARAAGGGRAGPGDARPQPPRRRRPRRLPRAAPPLRRADRDADRARHRDGPHRRPRARRRRLRRQAVQRPRGDLADPRRAAPQRPARRRRRGRDGDPGRRARARPAARAVAPRRRGARPLAQGVRPARRADAQRRPASSRART